VHTFHCCISHVKKTECMCWLLVIVRDLQNPLKLGEGTCFA